MVKKMSKNEARLGRVNEELMKALSQIITYELKNPDVKSGRPAKELMLAVPLVEEST